MTRARLIDTGQELLVRLGSAFFFLSLKEGTFAGGMNKINISDIWMTGWET